MSTRELQPRPRRASRVSPDAAPADSVDRRVKRACDPAVLAAIVDTGRHGPAVPLPDRIQDEFRARFGIDLSAVRVHRSPDAAAAAAALDARAFTFGRDSVLGGGGDDTPTLVHEAMHAAQFARAGAPARPRGVAAVDHPAHAEANAVSAAPAASPGGLVQRQETTEKPKEDQPVSPSGSVLAQLERSDTGRKIYAALPTSLQLGVQAQNLQQGFLATFVPALIASISDDDKKQLNEQFSSPLSSTAFSAGMFAGIHVGAVKDLWNNLEGLWELAKLGYEYSIPGLTEKVIREALAYGADPEAYKRKKQAEAEYAKELATAIWAFFQRISSDPAALVGTGESFGLAAAEYASQWFHGDFLKRSALMQGETIGEGIGMLATEIALLFLGPEEWVARGVVAAGRASKLAVEGTRLGRYVIELLEKAPEIARILKASKELKAA